MSPDRIFAPIKSTTQDASTILLVLLVSSLLLTGAVGTAAAVTHSSSTSTAADYDVDPLTDEGNAVDNSSVVVNGDGTVVSGKQVSYGDPAGRVVREYTFNGLTETDPLVVRGDNVETRDGQNVVVEGGSIAVFDENPDIRARYDNGTVEKVVVDGDNIETESGLNVKTEDGENVKLNRDAYNDHEFVVDILNTEYVGEGERMNISVKVGNIGHETAEDTVDIEVDGHRYSATMLELEPGETREIELDYYTRSGDAPNIDLTVKTPDDSETITAAVAKPSFRISIGKSDLAVSSGETVTVPATLDRTGGSSEQTYAIDFLVDGSVVDTELVSLQPGGSSNLEFSYKTSDSDTPSVRAIVSGPDGANATRTVAVRKPILAVNQIQTPENITESQEVSVTAAVENYGTEAKNQTVELVRSGPNTDETTVVGEKQVKVGKRNSKDISFSYQTNPSLHPNHQLTVRTADHNRTVTVATNATGVYQFESAPSGNTTAAPGSSYSLTPTVKNVGHANGTANVTFTVDGSLAKAVNVSLATGETESTNFSVNIPSNSSVSYKIETQYDSTTGMIQPADSSNGSETTSTATGNGTDAGTGANSGNGTDTGTTTPGGNSGSGGGGGGGLLSLSFLPPVPIMITTGVSVLLVGIIAHVAS